MEHQLSRELCQSEAGQRFFVDGQEYILGGKIGDGAVGLVRKAVRVEDSAQRAVKFLAPDPKYIDEAVFDDVASRFEREGKRGAKLDHPHLIKVYCYCENNQGEAFEVKRPTNPFLLLEFLSGRTLENYILGQPSDERGDFVITKERLHIAIQIVEALSHLHKSKLIHRDVKPANIFLTKKSKGQRNQLVRLGDFGIMKWGDFYPSLATGSLTVTNQKGLGTLKYMSPEQAINPKNVNLRSDIWSLGITLFELFSGQIFQSPHHIYEINSARLTRGTTTSRYSSMGYKLREEDELIAELLLDMFLRGVSGRPSIDKIQGNLQWVYETRYRTNWRDELDSEQLRLRR